MEQYLCRDPVELLTEIPEPLAKLPTVDQFTPCPKLYGNFKLPMLKLGEFMFDVTAADKRLIESRNKLLLDMDSQSLADTDPFRDLAKYNVGDRELTKMASIQSTYHITGGFHLEQGVGDMTDFAFFSVNSGPGAWVKYLQDILPLSQGYVTADKRRDWESQVLGNLDAGRLTFTYGDDSTGNLLNNWDSIIDTVNSQFPETFDLAIGIGAACESEESDFKLIMAEIVTCLGVLRHRAVNNWPGGNMIIKFGDTLTTATSQVLTLVAKCFEWITFFKPATSMDVLSEKYLICWNYNEESETSEPYSMLKSYLGSGEHMLPSEMDVEWLTYVNNNMLDHQIQQLESGKSDIRDYKRLAILLGLSYYYKL